MKIKNKYIKPAHLSVGVYGELFDTRTPGWYGRPPLRGFYQFHHQEIETLAELKATLRAGAFAWPGGYPLYLIAADGAPLCFDCARQEFHQIAYDFITDKTGRFRSQWRIVGCQINYEEVDCTCAHCNKAIPSAYGSN